MADPVKKIILQKAEGDVWEVIDIYSDGTMSDELGDEVTLGMLPFLIEEFIKGEEG